jgi:N6-adenosine-specific RNA methylase IME4
MNDFHCAFCGLVPEPGQKVCGSKKMADTACENVDAARMADGPLAGLKRNHYKVIYADPPWAFTTRSDKGKDRSPEQHYDCMTLDQIKAMPVQQIAAKDCVLVMWIIDTHMPMALEVMEAWGFTYKTKAFTWAKTNKNAAEMTALDEGAFFTGMGFWTRANPEDALLGTRGSPQRNEGGKGVRRFLAAPRREHSRKPDEIAERIEALVPGPYCELFSRTGRPGWDQMGNELGKFDDPVDMSRFEGDMTRAFSPAEAKMIREAAKAIADTDDDFSDLI